MTTATPNVITSINYPDDKSKWRYIEVYGMDFRPALKDMADTTSRLELWSWFKTESPPEGCGYTYWGHENVNKISDNLKNNDHSGATFGYCMRQIQYIAKNGFDKWNTLEQPE